MFSQFVFSLLVLLFFSLIEKYHFYEVRFNLLFSMILFAFYSYRGYLHYRKKNKYPPICKV